MGGGKGGGDPKMPVTDYYASVHYGICHGPVDELTEVWYGEKRLLAQSISSNQSVSVSKKNLFGGPKTEGGFSGTLDFMLGGSGQVLSPGLASSLVANGAAPVADPQKMPGFRGVLSLFVHGGGSTTSGGVSGWGSWTTQGGGGRRGANVGSNTAFIKSFWLKIRRAPKGAPFNTTITVNGMKLANPAGIIWECLTNTDWGMGGAAGNLDADSFTEAATTLANEGFGLAMLWHQQETIESFVGTVLNHIDASLSLDPFTGKFRLKLIRGDYDPETIPVFGPHNGELLSFDRRGWGETINEINVSWTNPANEQQETVTVHDAANIGLQGGTLISETRDYTGIRTAELALRVATRDLQQVATPLATAELRVNREAWQLLPGDVIALTWDRYGYESIPMRVSSVDYGKPGDSSITLKLVEDVFGMPEQAYNESDGSSWLNPAIDPEPMQYEHLTSAPYFMAANAAGEEVVETLDATSDLDLAFATHAASGVFSYDLMTPQQATDGSSYWADKGTVQPAGRGLLAGVLGREVASVIPSFDNLANGSSFAPGALLWIGPLNDTGELALITAVGSSGHTVQRGVLDTVPSAWPVGTLVWALHPGVLGSTKIERVIGETVTARMLTNTASGQLALDDAADVTHTMNGRLHRPYRPANLRANGELWPDPNTQPSYPVTITWAGRNRIEETSVINSWDEAAVTAEAGVEYRVLVEAVQMGGTVDGVVSDIVVTGETYEVNAGDVPANLSRSPLIRVTVTAQRDGLDSWQSPAVEFASPLGAPDGLSATYREPRAPVNLTGTVT